MSDETKKRNKAWYIVIITMILNGLTLNGWYGTIEISHQKDEAIKIYAELWENK